MAKLPTKSLISPPGGESRFRKTDDELTAPVSELLAPAVASGEKATPSPSHLKLAPTVASQGGSPASAAVEATEVGEPHPVDRADPIPTPAIGEEVRFTLSLPVGVHRQLQEEAWRQSKPDSKGRFKRVTVAAVVRQFCVEAMDALAK